MISIAVITGTIRENRMNPLVADYVVNYANDNFGDKANFELVDIADYKLSPFDKGQSPIVKDGDYDDPEVQKWADEIKRFDGYIFVTPEYNNNIPGSLKDGLDHLASEFSNKSAGVVSYGETLGVTANIMLRLTLANFNMAVTANMATYSIDTDFDYDAHKFIPEDSREDNLRAMISTVVKWSKALETLRS